VHAGKYMLAKSGKMDYARAGPNIVQKMKIAGVNLKMPH
jgi:hypothetical protein